MFRRKQKNIKWENLTLKEKLDVVAKAQVTIDALTKLQEWKNIPVGDVWVGAVDQHGDEYFDPIELTRHEYAAIRRYLIRNRQHILRKEGLL